MRTAHTDNRAELIFDSVSELVDYALVDIDATSHRSSRMRDNPEWYGGVRSMEELAQIAREGMSAEGIDAARISEDKVTVLEREQDMPAFHSFYDMTGADVDVARHLSGEPESMINYSMVDTPKVGRVITMVVSVDSPSRVSADSIVKRGKEIVSLVFAVERIGFQVELWADLTTYGRQKMSGRIRTLVKGPGEQLDPGQVMFAFTHPGMLRGLYFCAMHLFPRRFHQPLSVGGSYGQASDKDDPGDYPEGSLFLPTLMDDSNSETLVTDTLRKLELIP